jgi:hypothetical protein
MSAGQWEGGKGSTFRQVDQKKFDENWELIFGKKAVINSVSDNEETLDGSTKEKKKTERETNP